MNPAVPARSLAELIALAKANPGKLNYASSGHGLAAHLAGELFKAEAKVNLVHVPYKGAAPALQDVIAGHVQMMFATASSVVSHIQDGKVRALAVTTLKRTALLPDLPTDRRTRPQGLRRHHLARPRRAGQDAARGRQDAQLARCWRRWRIRRSGSRWTGSASTSSAVRRTISPPISAPKSRNGPRS